MKYYPASSSENVNKNNVFKQNIKLVFLAFGLFSIMVSSVAFSAESVWRNIQASADQNLKKSVPIGSLQASVEPAGSNKSSHLSQFRALSLNEPLLKERLSMDTATSANSGVNFLARAQSKTASGSVITIPLPSGKSVRVRLTADSVMPPKLAARHPEIKTWDAVGVDDSAMRGVVDFTSYGFHAMLFMPDGNTVFVERANKDSNKLYRSFSKRANKASFDQDFKCLLHDDPAINLNQTFKAAKQNLARQQFDLVKYRLAVAATGQYTQYHGGVSNALSAINTTISRVNQINERDLNIRFELIDNEEDIIYSQPLNDPYTNNHPSIMLGENIINLRNTIGRSNYDLGHVFTQGDASGLASLGSACDETSRSRFPTADGFTITLTGAKEGGITGSPSPDGDAFDVDFVVHELGHQIGGTHTFNSNSPASGSCAGDNRTARAAVEPGSGSTIMAYAGICGPNDLQKHSDAYYHTISIAQILSYTREDTIGKSCGTRISRTDNTDPLPDAKVDTVIPALTPFILTGSASDPDGDRLTYVWDGMDIGTASDVDVDKGDNALIRSRSPSGSPTRYIPRLSDLFVGRAAKGEHLPVANRDLKFSFVARDGRGGIETDDLKVHVSGTGRTFALKSHGIRRNLGVGQQTKVSWDVAGTSSAPVNCRAVDISLIQVNGRRVLVKGNTANDGSETVTIPANARGMSGARMMVACHRPASTFFNIANGDLTIVSQGQGEADSANNNGAGNAGSSSGGGSGSGGGGGAFGMVYLALLFLFGFLVQMVRTKDALKVQKISIRSLQNQHNKKGKK